MMMKLCDYSIDLSIGPIVEQVGVGQLWECGLHCNGMLDGTSFDATAVIRCEGGKSLLKDVNVE